MVFLLGRQVHAAYAYGSSPSVLVGVRPVLLVLGTAAIGLLASRRLAVRTGKRSRSRSHPRGLSHSRRRFGFDGTERASFSLHGLGSVLFPPTRHERLHDSNYLRQMLQVEEEHLRESRRRSGKENGFYSRGPR
ncbi:MAG: hypothetical protein VKJ05_09730 [Synechococcaceae cyanobacterium]|nr:hypothetical protein [Synechococcaceae cyanobacterium]